MNITTGNVHYAIVISPPKVYNMLKSAAEPRANL